MPSSSDASDVLAEDWLGFSRRAAAGVREALSRYSTAGERGEGAGRGEGGDETLVIDRAAEDAVFAELERLGAPLTAVSEERGHVAIAGGGPAHVVIDPIDGSLNAKRGLRSYGLSIAVAGGSAMADVAFGYVADLGGGEEWWARRGEGAYRGEDRLETLAGDRGLELLGVDSATPRLVAAAAEALQATGAHRLRALGSIALHMCAVAAGRLDAMLSLAPSRSVDAAAGQLIVREAGGAAAFPDTADGALGATLDLDMRSRVVAAASEEILAGVVQAMP